MMKKKGFTLVELLVVISLLALIGVSIGISLNRTLKRQSENNYDEFLNKVISAANLYASNNNGVIDSLYKDKGYILVPLQELIDDGLISPNLINPNTKEKIDPEEDVKILLDNNGTISIEYPVNIPKEDYLQTMDIVVEYGDNSIPTYCYYKINEPELRYIKQDGTALNNLSKDVNIKCTGDDEVDTSKLGTYELKYDYLLQDGSGVWKQAIRKVTVVDNIPPVCSGITGDATTWENVTRTISVLCTDNYGCLNATETQVLRDVKTGTIGIKDLSNNQTNCNVNVYSDTIKPSGVAFNASLNSDKTVGTLTGNGQDSLSGINYYYFGTESELNSITSVGTAITPTTNVITQTTTVTRAGKYYFYAQDQAGNLTRSGMKQVNIPPQITMEAKLEDGTAYDGSWVNENVYLHMTFINNGFEIDKASLKYCDTQGVYSKCDTYTAETANSTSSHRSRWGNGKTSVNTTAKYQIADVEGNYSNIVSTNIKIDRIAPTLSISVPSGTTYSKSKTATVTVTESGGSGLPASDVKIYYAWGTSAVACNSMTSSITISPTAGSASASGTITISSGTGAGKLYVCNKDAAITDGATNSLARGTVVSENMYLDNTKPTLTVASAKANGANYTAGTKTSYSVVLTLSASDAHSGVNKTTLKYCDSQGVYAKCSDYDEAAMNYPNDRALSDASLNNTSTWARNMNTTVWYRVQDNAGNWSDWLSYRIYIDKTTTTTTRASVVPTTTKAKSGRCGACSVNADCRTGFSCTGTCVNSSGSYKCCVSSASDQCN